MAAQHAVQRNARDPQSLRRLGDILLGACKRVHKIEPFTVGTRLRPCRRGWRGRCVIWLTEANQIGGSDHRPIADDGCATDNGHQLTNVPRPVVPVQGLNCVGCKVGYLPIKLGSGLTKEMACQRLNIAVALTQRRQRQGEDVQPVIQVLAEPALRYCLTETHVCGRDHPDIDIDRLASANAHDLALLQKAQEMCLQIHRHVADFVEEESATIGVFDLPFGPGESTCESALLIAEQLRRDEVGVVLQRN